MQTIDLKKQFQSLYHPSAKRIELIEVPDLPFILIDGQIEPGSEPSASPGFAAATEVIYGLAYTLKFMLKKHPLDPVDYPVMALEGLWWVEDGVFDITVKDNWFYTLMILQPEIITPEIFAEGLEQVRRKKGDSPRLDALRLDCWREGLCVQTLHRGPYATEPETLARMQEFMRQNGLSDRVGSLGGKHHEIYLGDPRKSAPEKLKTVLRHPVERAD